MIGFLLFLLLILCIALSALFSAAEIGFLSVNKIRLRHMVEKGDIRAQKIQEFLQKPEEFFSSILVGNNLVLVGASTIATYLGIIYIGEKFGPTITGISLTIFLLLFGEILPKTLFRQYADSLSYSIVDLLVFFRKLLSPIVFVFVKLLQVVARDPVKQMKRPFVTREEIRVLVKEGERMGVLQTHERAMIHSIFSFGKTRVEDVLIPLTDVVVIDKDSSRKDLLEIARKNNYTRIPVFDDRIDNIVGIVNIYEVLYSHKKRWQDCIRPVFFVPYSKRVSVLIKELQKRHERICVVVNELGTPMGIVSMEDLMEEIVGEIYDEDDQQFMIRKTSLGTFLVNGRCTIEEFNRYTGLKIAAQGYETIGGYIYERLGSIPKEGDRIKGLEFSLTIEKMDRNRIASVRVQLK